jgi:hypothetical protein
MFFWNVLIINFRKNQINFIQNISNDISNVSSIVKLKKRNVFVQKIQKQGNSYEGVIMPFPFSISLSELVSLNEE